MNIFRGLLSAIFGKDSAPQGTSAERDRQKHWDERKGNQIKTALAYNQGKYAWKLAMRDDSSATKQTLRANTKSEARAKFKNLIGCDVRLPVGLRVVRCV